VIRAVALELIELLVQQVIVQEVIEMVEREVLEGVAQEVIEPQSSGLSPLPPPLFSLSCDSCFKSLHSANFFFQKRSVMQQYTGRLH